MSRSRKIACALVALVVVGLLVWWQPSNEPEYQGVPLSRWVARYWWQNNTPAGTSAEVKAALRALRSDAIPYLINLSDSPVDSEIFRRFRSQIRGEIPFQFSPGAGHGFTFAKYAWRVREADFTFFALEDLTPDAGEILPLLSRRFNSPDITNCAIAWRSATAIKSNLAAAEPALLMGLRDEREANREVAAQALNYFRLRSVPLVVAYGEAVEKASPVGRWRLVSQIQKLFGPLSIEALPALIRSLQPPGKSMYQMRVARVICEIAPGRREGLEVLTNYLADPVWRKGALSALAGLTPVPSVPAELLVPALHDASVLKDQVALPALMKLGPPKDVALPILMQLLPVGDAPVRINAARAILMLAPNHGVAIGTLISLMQSSDDANYPAWAAEILGEAGTNATAAIPQVKKLLDDPATPNAKDISTTMQKLLDAEQANAQATPGK